MLFLSMLRQLYGTEYNNVYIVSSDQYLANILKWNQYSYVK